MKLHRISVLSKVLNVKYCTVGGQKKVRGSGIGGGGGMGVSVESVPVSVQIGYGFWEQASRFNH